MANDPVDLSTVPGLTPAPPLVGSGPVASGTVPSGDVQSWLQNALSGTWNVAKGGLGAGIGGMAVPAALSLINPALGAGALVAGGVGGAMAGQMGQDLLSQGSVDPLQTGIAGASELVGGPILSGGKTAISALLRKLAFKQLIPEAGEDFTKLGLQGASNIDVTPYAAKIKELMTRPEAAVIKSQAEKALPTLESLASEASLRAPLSQASPVQAAELLRQAGAARTPDMLGSGAADPLYKILSDRIRATGAANIGMSESQLAQVLADREVQRQLEEQALQALNPAGTGLARIVTLTGLGLGPLMYYLINRPGFAMAAALAPYMGKAGGGLFNVGRQSPVPLLQGVAPVLPAGIARQYNPYTAE